MVSMEQCNNLQELQSLYVMPNNINVIFCCIKQAKIRVVEFDLDVHTNMLYPSITDYSKTVLIFSDS